MRGSAKAMTLGELAAAVGAELRPASASARVIDRVSSFENASPEALVFAADGAACAAAQACAAGAVVTSRALCGENAHEMPALLVKQPKQAFAAAARLLRAAPAPTGVHPLASVAPTARLGDEVSVEAFAVIEEDVQLGQGVWIGAGAVIGAGSVLGAGCVIYPRVVLYAGTALGARVVVHAGAVLGSDGFGYVRDGQTGSYTQFPQQGRLVIEDDVEIGANTTIDRGALEETRIGRGVKIDNLVHIGHNVQVGADVVIAAQTGISGSSSIGEGAVVAGQVGIADHVTIGPGAILGAQCGVPSNKQIRGPGVLFWGTPARPIAQYLKELAVLARMARAGRGKRE